MTLEDFKVVEKKIREYGKQEALKQVMEIIEEAYKACPISEIKELKAELGKI